MMKELFTQTITPLAERVPKLATTVATLVDAMLARERSQRPGDLREVYGELARYARVSAPAFGPPAVARAAPESVAPSPTAAFGFASTESGSEAGTPERQR
jgi:hypothetical protein